MSQASPSRALPAIDFDSIKDRTYRIEDYALIGDGRSAALVCRNGSIDWLCWPRFDSEACFAALLGTTDHGRWILAPRDPIRVIRRHYQHGTAILETTFECATGAVRIIDFMAPGAAAPTLARIVQGLHGSVSMSCKVELRFGYGRLQPWIQQNDNGFIAKAGAHGVLFESPVSPHHGATDCEFAVEAGHTVAFALRYFPSHEAPPVADDLLSLLEQTQSESRAWIAGFTKSGPWRNVIERSLITLRTLIYRPTGGLVAAPTTSLPEQPAGTLNWDYRFCWLRDATFTLTALLNAGFSGEATAWRDWILRTLGAEPAKLHIMYRIDGEPALNERSLDWLPGYRWATPVRVGNSAAGQLQVDVYGELLDAFDVCRRSGIAPSAHGDHVEREIVLHLVKVWNKPGHGIWESRQPPRHYTYSRVMAWVGIDRYLRGNARRAGENLEWLDDLDRLRTLIHAEVCSEGYDEGLGTFVQTYGSQSLDACLLLLPIVGFLPADDARISRTIRAIERELVVDGLVMRHSPEGSVREGAFLACTCWLADCQRMQGRRDDAVATLQRVLDVANDLGLLSEEYSPTGKHLAGNFPQALTHLAVVNAALGLSGPVLQRGGG